MGRTAHLNCNISPQDVKKTAKVVNNVYQDLNKSERTLKALAKTNELSNKELLLGDAKNWDFRFGLGLGIRAISGAYNFQREGNVTREISQLETITNIVGGSLVGIGAGFVGARVSGRLASRALSSSSRILGIAAKGVPIVGVGIEVAANLGFDSLVNSVFGNAKKQAIAQNEIRNASFKTQLNGVSIVGSF